MEQESTQALDQSLAATADSETLQALFAQASYRLRESRKAVLRRHAVDSEADLLARIVAGELAPHPAYEDYLSALIIGQNQMQIRAELAAHLADATVLPSISVHLRLRELIEARYAARLAEPVRLAQDALLLSFDNGVMLEVRYFSRQEYSIMWCRGEAEHRIDTAPPAAQAEHSVAPAAPVAQGGHRVDSAPPIAAAGHRVDPTPLAGHVEDAGQDYLQHFSGLLDLLLEDPLRAASWGSTT